jgi:hypothetical protein
MKNLRLRTSKRKRLEVMEHASLEISAETLTKDALLNILKNEFVLMILTVLEKIVNFRIQANY